MNIPMTFDDWFHLLELIGGVPLLTKILWTLLEIRDQFRDVGTAEPPTKLFKRVETVENGLRTNSDAIIDIRARLDFKRAGDGRIAPDAPR